MGVLGLVVVGPRLVSQGSESGVVVGVLKGESKGGRLRATCVVCALIRVHGLTREGHWTLEQWVCGQHRQPAECLLFWGELELFALA